MPRRYPKSKKKLGPAEIIGALFLIALGSAWTFPKSTNGKIIASVAVVVLFGTLIGVAAWLLYRKRNAPSVSLSNSVAASPNAPWQHREPERNLYPEWKAATSGDSPVSNIDTTRWSVELLNALEWKRFEQVCAGYFEALGFRAEVAREGADGGVDIKLYTEGSDRPGMIVQCKAWKTYKVGVKHLRELFGVMAADGVGEGAFVTTGIYTREAREFATGKNLHLIDGADLLDKIASLTQEQQGALLKSAISGDFTTPTCPSCGIKMINRISKSDGDPFWGCANYPRCRSTLRVARA